MTNDKRNTPPRRGLWSRSLEPRRNCSNFIRTPPPMLRRRTGKKKKGKEKKGKKGKKKKKKKKREKWDKEREREREREREDAKKNTLISFQIKLLTRNSCSFIPNA
jgi:hypothetical protein